jgi:hypothetical protein
MARDRFCVVCLRNPQATENDDPRYSTFYSLHNLWAGSIGAPVPGALT